jgi:nucleotidyltransferase substrate binding protein (TIGR01987 family)
MAMDNKDIRWRQRLRNFEKSMRFLEKAMDIDHPDIIQKAGLVQFFEMSFELAWNTMKDYLEEQGFQGIRSPRDSIKKAFETGLIKNGQLWLESLQDRNNTSHMYDEEAAETIVTEIRKSYFPLLKDLLITLAKNTNDVRPKKRRYKSHKKNPGKL